MIGQVLEGYELTQKLGDGGTGETYLAMHRESGQRAAVKVLLAELSSDPSLTARFLAEARTASQVNHVGIVDLYACGVAPGGRAFLVMELLEGKTLTDALIELGSVSDMESFADIGWQLATLLEAVHGTGIIHGALKPDGIFMTFPPAPAGRTLVKLLDFGTARLTLDVRHSQTGSLLGAPLYMAPEVGRGLGNVDRRADVYSLGCILFEMACGRPPFVREGKGELIIAHATETAPSVASLEPAVPQAVDTLIGRMLTKSPATRPQTMAEVALVLERLARRPSRAEGPVVAPAGPAAGSSAPALAAPVAPLAPSAAPLGACVPAPRQLLTTAESPEPAPAQIRRDPTALLPPEPLDAPDRDSPSVHQSWIARVKQATVLIEPEECSRPRASGRGRAGSPRRSSPALRRARELSPAPARGTRGPRSSLSLPIVILTTSIIVVIGTSVLLLRSRKPTPPRNARAPLAAPVTTRGEDEMPRADLAAPAPSFRPPVPQPPATLHPTAPAPKWPGDGEPKDLTAADEEEPEQGRLGRRPPAKRW